MRKLIGLILTSVMLSLTLVGSSDVKSADAHSWPSNVPTPLSYCQWRLNETGYNQSHFLSTYGWFHYGDVHVVRCHYRSFYVFAQNTRHNLCMQVLEWYGWYGEDWYDGTPTHSVYPGASCGI